MNVKVKSISRCFFNNKKTMIFISLLFMATIVFSPLIPTGNGWIDMSEAWVAETEAELVNAVNSAPANERRIICLAKDIVLEKPLEIPKGKDIMLSEQFWPGASLIGANGMDTIVVKSGGFLILHGRITVTHAEGDSGRGAYVERGGTLNLSGAIISGNSADKGGGVYNEGLLNVGGDEDRDSLIANNVAAVGGGVYNRGTLETKSRYVGSQIQGNTSPNGEENDVFTEEPNDGSLLYLLAIVSVVVSFVAIAGLLFYRSKNRKQAVA
jgi:hypothetical protein